MGRTPFVLGTKGLGAPYGWVVRGVLHRTRSGAIRAAASISERTGRPVDVVPVYAPPRSTRLTSSFRVPVQGKENPSRFWSVRPSATPHFGGGRHT